MGPPRIGVHDAFAEAERASAERQAGLCSSANAAGVGLRGEYFAEERWQGGALLIRIDDCIDFDASLDWPAEHARHPPRSVRWSGWIKPPISGRYRFHADMADARVLVSRHTLSGPGAMPDIEMTAGRFHPIVVELAQVSAATTRFRLEWTPPHGARFVVPRPLLYMPTESVGG